jgi:hydrogenase nickel incorporation protein HypB
MCAICGCNSHAEASASHAAERRDKGQGEPVTPQGADQQLHFGASAAGLSVPGMSASRIITLEANVLGANQRFADANRRHFAAHGVAAYNLVSSPGSGKTTLLCATIKALQQRSPELPLAVIEGDQQTELDAQRIRASGTQAIQINTGRGCHLDARMVGEAFSRLDLHAHSHAPVHAQARCDDTAHDTVRGSGALLLIENVGNLVCPALWDLGENAKVALLSVTEGDDKPIKYPDMFAAADLMLINKIDLLPYVDFDVERCVSYARRINPDIAVLQISATRGDGMDAWLDWLQGMTC